MSAWRGRVNSSTLAVRRRCEFMAEVNRTVATPADPFAGLMIKLRDLIAETFTDEEFADLIFTYVKTGDFDYAALSGVLTYKKKVFETVAWAKRFGDTTHVLWLARLVAEKRPARQDLADLAAEIAALANPTQAAAASPPKAKHGAIPRTWHRRSPFSNSANMPPANLSSISAAGSERRLTSNTIFPVAVT